MRKAISAVALVAVLALVGGAGAGQAWGAEGGQFFKLWNDLNPIEKKLYILGIGDGIKAAALREGNIEIAKKWATRSNLSDIIISDFDAVYSREMDIAPFTVYGFSFTGIMKQESQKDFIALMEGYVKYKEKNSGNSANKSQENNYDTIIKERMMFLKKISEDLMQ